jgi:hypothetical protein
VKILLTDRDLLDRGMDATPSGTRQSTAGNPQRLLVIVSRTLQRQFVRGVGVSGPGEK